MAGSQAHQPKPGYPPFRLTAPSLAPVKPAPGTLRVAPILAAGKACAALRTRKTGWAKPIPPLLARQTDVNLAGFVSGGYGKLMIYLCKTAPSDFSTTDNLFQTHFWGNIKEKSGQRPLYFDAVFKTEDSPGTQFFYAMTLSGTILKHQEMNFLKKTFAPNFWNLK